MAAQKGARVVEKKRKSKKRKSRTEVSSSESSSESEVEQRKREESPSTEGESEQSTSGSSPEHSKVSKRKRSKTISTPSTNGDVPMHNASPSPSPAPEPAIPSRPQDDATSGKHDEKFDAIYIRKITTELADDLDKVREAQDFKANSIPMLIHALKQGESLFSVEEKRRVIATSKA